MREDSIIQEIKRRVKAVSPTAEVILYGSYARGDAHKDSDIDILILTDGNHLSFKEEEEFTMPLYLLEVQSGIPISPLVITKHEWDTRPFVTPFYLNVKSEGIKL